MFRRRMLTAVGVTMVAVSVLVSSAWMGRADAAQTATVGAGNALKVSPVRLDVKMDPGTTQTIELNIQNLTSSPAVLRPFVNDFVASGDESGRPNIILEENEYAPSYSLKRLITPPADVSVAAGETKSVKVTIVAPKGAPAGGYFGAVRFAPVSGPGSSNTNVNLAASVGTLVLLRMSGDVREELKIESFDVRKASSDPGTLFVSNKGLSAVVRFKNTGNVHVEPFGSIRVKRFGKLVDTVEINNTDVRGNVLPGSIRRFDNSLSKLGSFGKYTLEGNFGYGTTGQLLTSTTTFYVIPLFLILIGVGVILLLLFLIFALPRMIRAYNRRVIRRANRRRRY